MPRKKKVTVVERKLGRERALGLCWGDEDKIEVDERLQGKEKMMVYIHEFLHHLDLSKKESDVEKEANKIADFLWDNGFRKVDLK